MKRFFFTVFFNFLIILYCLADCGVLSKNFKSGEKITYQVYYNLGFIWLNAGNAAFDVSNIRINNKNYYKLRAVGHSNPSFESLFLVRDTFISYVDTNNITPVRAIKYTNEGRYHAVDDFTFSKQEDIWKVTTKLKRAGVWKQPIVETTENCGFDILTSIYRLRCLEEKSGILYLRLDDGEYKVSIKHMGLDKIKLHGGDTHIARKIQISLVEGNVFGKGGFMTLWVSDDSQKIPLLIESPLKVGKVKAVFNLKN